jgi:hypothetical protein
MMAEEAETCSVIVVIINTRPRIEVRLTDIIFKLIKSFLELPVLDIAIYCNPCCTKASFLGVEGMFITSHK